MSSWTLKSPLFPDTVFTFTHARISNSCKLRVENSTLRTHKEIFEMLSSMFGTIEGWKPPSKDGWGFNWKSYPPESLLGMLQTLGFYQASVDLKGKTYHFQHNTPEKTPCFLYYRPRGRALSSYNVEITSPEPFLLESLLTLLDRFEPTRLVRLPAIGFQHIEDPQFLVEFLQFSNFSLISTDEIVT